MGELPPANLEPASTDTVRAKSPLATLRKVALRVAVPLVIILLLLLFYRGTLLVTQSMQRASMQRCIVKQLSIRVKQPRSQSHNREPASYHHATLPNCVPVGWFKFRTRTSSLAL